MKKRKGPRIIEQGTDRGDYFDDGEEQKYREKCETRTAQRGMETDALSL